MCKTIDGIVPVMASSLKNANADSLDLHIASRDFLRVFTDAANHIPRYRRNKCARFTYLKLRISDDALLASLSISLRSLERNISWRLFVCCW